MRYFLLFLLLLTLQISAQHNTVVTSIEKETFLFKKNKADKKQYKKKRRFLKKENETKKDTASQLRILSWNIFMLPMPKWLGGKNTIKRKKHRAKMIGHSLRKMAQTDSAYHLILFQEAFTDYARNTISDSLKNHYPHQYYDPQNTGIWILSQFRLQEKDYIPYKGKARSKYADWWSKKGVRLYEGTFKNQKIQLSNVHFQAGYWFSSFKKTRLAQIKVLGELLKRNDDGEVVQIIGGDFNVPKKKNGRLSESYQKMREFLRLNKKDKHILEGKQQCSYDKKINKVCEYDSSTLLDYVFVRKNGKKSRLKSIKRKIQLKFQDIKLRKYKYGTKKGESKYLSDHLPIECVIDFN